MAQDEIAWGPRDAHAVLNHDLRRIDGPAKVSGQARYSQDIRLPGMLFARVWCCPWPAARVKVDVSQVNVPGVHVAIALTDGLRDGNETRWLGQPVAAVAAETPELAEDALRQVAVEGEIVDYVLTHEQATAEDAPQISKDGNVQREREDGDAAAVAAALAKAAAVVEATYTLPVQHHVSLETHGVVVDYSGGDSATVYASTQGTHGISPEAAEVLGLARGDVRTLVEHMGGGFGAKFGLDLPGKIACRLAKEAKRPIHLLFTRHDEFLAGGNRSGSVQRLKGGMSADGTLVAIDADVDRLGGMGFGAFPGQPYIYSAGASHSRVRSVLTNTDGSRAMRAPGHPQASFGIESLIDELCSRLGLDQLEVRKKNLADPVYHRQLDRVAREIGWADHPHKSGPPRAVPELATGIGFGVATWGGGGRRACQVDVRIEPDGSVVAACGTQDLGTGTRTYLAAIVAEELGLPIEAVTPRIGDSFLGMSVGSGGSATTGSLAPAVKVAAVNARRALAERVAQSLGAAPDALIFAGGKISTPSDAKGGRSIPWREACAQLGSNALEVRGEWQQSLQASGVHGAQAAKVEVDTLTGDVRVLKMVAIQDCGLPLNRTAVKSQITGGVIEALSYGLFEERVLDPWIGAALNATLEDYKIAGSADIPEIVALIDDDDPREQAIGMAEPTIIPGHSAIANAIFNACGARLRALPFTNDKVLTALFG
jgi:xanthine dehydrogenase YagR molybdenum-binding subunit